jgi:polyhydroxybutyrate depolymerase
VEGVIVHQSIDVGGQERTLTVVGPEDSPRRRDLILIFHGSKQTADAHRRFTGQAFDAMADSGAAVVAYLDGYRGNWNDARKESFFPARLENVDDVAFTRAAIEHLEGSHGIDPQRVFLVGYSNGGQMVFRLIHEIPEVLAGAAAISATMPAPASFSTPASPPKVVPMPILLIHGTKDRIVPYRGGTMSGWTRRMFKVGGTTLSMPETADYFARRNGITTPPRFTRVPKNARRPARTWVDQGDYEQPGRPRVRLFTVHGGGHTVPGPRKAPFILGSTGQDISAADAIADFFNVTTE